MNGRTIAATARGTVQIWWCRLRGKHKGDVDFFDGKPYWMCDECGAVDR